MSSEETTKNSEKSTKVEVEQLQAKSSHELEDSQLEKVAGGAEEPALGERHAEGGGR